MATDQENSPGGRPRRVSLPFKLLLAALIPVVALVLIEGSASVFILASAMLGSVGRAISEPSYIQDDPDLGWSNAPGVTIEDCWGPGTDVSVNAQGFRGAADFTPQTPDGRIRIVCSGDSFTFGVEVGDDDTWAAELEVVDPRLETVNMGVGGYGTGQAYLRALRDAATLERDIHLFCVISRDLIRMGRTKFQAREKPMVELAGDELVTRNVPVGEASFLRWLFWRNSEAISDLRAAQLFLGTDEGPGVAAAPQPYEVGEAGPVLIRMLEELDRVNEDRGSVLVVVFIPFVHDYTVDVSRTWRVFVESEAESRGIQWIDLVPAFRELPYSEATRMFVGSDVSGRLADAGHFSPAGNRFIARKLYEALQGCPPAAAKLTRAE